MSIRSGIGWDSHRLEAGFVKTDRHGCDPQLMVMASRARRQRSSARASN